MTEAIKAAAENVAAAKLRSEQGAAALEAAAAALDKVRARISDLDSERAQIVADRKAGKTSPKQGARLAEIGADIEGLNEILAESVQAHGTVAAEFNRLNQSVTAAEYALATTSDQALLGNLKQIATELDQRLLEAVTEVAATAKRLGFNRPQWFPSSLLASTLRRLDLEGGALS
jgi:chromosome segregation ATPase